MRDWLFDLDDEVQIEKIVPAVLRLAKDPESARKKAVLAGALVRQKQKETMAVLSKELAV